LGLGQFEGDPVEETPHVLRVQSTPTETGTTEPATAYLRREQRQAVPGPVGGTIGATVTGGTTAEQPRYEVFHRNLPFDMCQE
jgi:hypothetical protein